MDHNIQPHFFQHVFIIINHIHPRNCFPCPQLFSQQCSHHVDIILFCQSNNRITFFNPCLLKYFGFCCISLHCKNIGFRGKSSASSSILVDNNNAMPLFLQHFSNIL